jgi:integrase
VSQLPLFSLATKAGGAPSAAKGRPDPDSERLLTAFSDARLGQGAHPQSVRREVSQLRAVLREARAINPSVALRSLLSDLELVGRALREPLVSISRATGRARLLAVQRFIWIMEPSQGRNPTADLRTLDVLLPARRATSWHTTGTLVAGSAGRRRRRGPTLDAADLHRIVEAAGRQRGAQTDRDRALAALHCFSGLRPEEIVRLRWQDLATELTVQGRYGLTATVRRGGRDVRMLLPEPTSDAIEWLARAAGGTVETLTGPVFRARGGSDQHLSYRAARDVIEAACRRAGLPIVEAVALRAAYAHWLRVQGLSDHEVTSMLGLARVKSVDRLLRHHDALDAQRVVRAMMAC